MWFFGGLGLKLLIIPKDEVFGKILLFSNIFGFPMVNWTPILTETVNFNCILFEPEFKILKDSFKQCVFLNRDYLWSNFQQDQTIFVGVRNQKITKRGHFIDAECWINTKIFENFWFHNHICYSDESYHRYISW